MVRTHPFTVTAVSIGAIASTVRIRGCGNNWDEKLVVVCFVTVVVVAFVASSSLLLLLLLLLLLDNDEDVVVNVFERAHR
jgi:hypothetical protein